MKRSPLRRSSLPAGRSPLSRVNATRKAKRAKEYKAFLSSAVWKRIRKAALERAGHRCEAIRPATFAMPFGGAALDVVARCGEIDRLTVHHLTYVRFGGDELPEDLQVLCKSCHDYHSALTGKRLA